MNVPTEVVDSGHSTKDVLNSNDLDVNVNGKNVVKGEIKVEPRTEDDFNYDKVRKSDLEYSG